MKKIQVILCLFLIGIVSINAQEKKIKFNKGTLNICSSKKFIIEGYNGNEVIIESLHPKRNTLFGSGYKLNGNTIHHFPTKSNKEWKVDAKINDIKFFPNKKIDSIKQNQVVFLSNDYERKKGLTKLGKGNADKDLGIYFTIEQNGDELIFKDDTDRQLVMVSNEKYAIKIPNSIKLNWKTQSCTSKDIHIKGKAKSDFRPFFYNTKPSILTNFSGEVEISSTLSNLELNDVTGPVSISTIGGNVTVVFDKKTPNKLYSIYTNNGFIDITLPKNSSVLVDADASSVFSDINFKVLEEITKNDLQQMKLKLNSGKVKLKLNAGLGNVYLRKQQ